MDLEARTAAAARTVLAASSLASHLKTRHDVRHCYLGEAMCPVAPASYEARFMPATGKWL